MFYIDKQGNIRTLQEKQYTSSQKMYAYLWKQSFGAELNYPRQTYNTHPLFSTPFCLYKKKYHLDIK